MGKTRLRLPFLALAAAALLAGPLAHATSVSYFLDQSNTTPPFPDGTNYASVTIDDFGGSDSYFTVTPIGFTADSNFGIESFGFSLLSSAPSLSGDVLPPPNWSATTPGGNMDGFGAFTWVLGPTSNPGGNRLDPLQFSITGVPVNTLLSYLGPSSGDGKNPPGEGAVIFAVHIGGISVPGSEVDSAFFGGDKLQVVPLPATAWLLLSGVAALGALARRRRAEA